MESSQNFVSEFESTTEPVASQENTRLTPQQIPVRINVSVMKVKTEGDFFIDLEPENLDFIQDSDDFRTPLSSHLETFHLSEPEVTFQPSVDVNDIVVDPVNNLDDISNAVPTRASEPVVSGQYGHDDSNAPSGNFISEEILRDEEDSVETEPQSLEAFNEPNASENLRDSGSGEATQEISDASKLVNINRKIADLKSQLAATMEEKKKLESQEKNVAGPSQKRLADSRNNSAAKRFRCARDACAYKTDRQHRLDDHMKIHEDEKTLSCPEPSCPYTSKTLMSLRKHKLNHTVKEKFQCPGCDRSFVLKYGLEVHLRTHTKEKPFKCPEPNCKYAGAQRVHLLSHKKRRHP